MLQLFGQINKNVIDPTYISSIRICARKSLFTDQLTFYSVVEFSKDGEKIFKRNSTIVKIFQMLMNK